MNHQNDIIGQAMGILGGMSKEKMQRGGKPLNEAAAAAPQASRKPMTPITLAMVQERIEALDRKITAHLNRMNQAKTKLQEIKVAMKYEGEPAHVIESRLNDLMQESKIVIK
jgi:hypothetical protein